MNTPAKPPKPIDKLRHDIRYLADSLSFNAREIQSLDTPYFRDEYADVLEELRVIQGNLAKSLHVLRRELGHLERDHEK